MTWLHSMSILNSRCTFALSRRDAPEVLQIVSPQIERAQGRPGARCTRGLACGLHKTKCTRAYRFSGEHPAFPAQWLYGLYRALPGERIRVVTVAAGLIARPIRLDRIPHRQLGTSNGCRNHAVFPYATTPFVCAPFDRSRVWINPEPPCHSLARLTPPR